MSTLIGVNVKNAAIWLPRFLCQVEKLKGNIKRIVMLYGESSDATFSILDHWSKTSKFKVEIYSEPYLPLEERQGAATLARVERDVQSLLKAGNEEYYLKLDSDLVDIPPNLIPRLIEDNADVAAPYVWTEGREQKTFFDTYGFRKDNCQFNPFNPPRNKGKLEVDSVGTCFMADRAAAIAGVYANPYPLINFCVSLKRKGFQIYADYRLNVTHVDLERYGIAHNPMRIGLSYVGYISNGGGKLSTEEMQVELFSHFKESYDRWVTKHSPTDVDWTRRFNGSRPLITASYKVLNESGFIEYSLKSIYPYVDHIDIVEGAIKEAMPSANPDGSSTDDTVKIIMDFPDPENKIRLIQGKWKTREQMQAKLLELCSSKWMLFIDGDEVVDGGDAMRRFCMENQSGDIVHAQPDRFLNFWHDFHHIAYSLNPQSPWAKHGIPHAFLVWRDLPGLNFSANHTIAMDAYGKPVSIARQDSYSGRVKTLSGVRVYHFGNAKGLQSMKDKLALSHPRLLGNAEEDPWLSGKMPSDMVIEEFNDGFSEALIDHPDRDKTRIRVTEEKPAYRFELVEATPVLEETG